MLDDLEKQGASNAEKAFAMRNYFDAMARQKATPVHGYFELTPLCNLNCKMCYIHLTEQQMRETGRTLLTGSQWISIMEQAIEAGMIEALLTGGEALSHPDFDEIYLYLYNHGISPAVNTNALLMTKERIDFFRRYPPRSIQITLYGSDDESYEKVTGRRCFSQVMNAIQSILEADLPVHIGITPSRYMAENGERLIELVESLGISYSINFSLTDPRQETGRSSMEHDLSLDEYVHLFKTKAKLRKKELQPKPLEDTPLPGGGEKQEVLGLPCAAGSSSFCIGWNGFLRPCVSFIDLGVDLTEELFIDAWKKMHDATQKYPIPRECIGCAYQPICCPCVIEHSAGAPLGHAKPAFCKRSRRFVSEGLFEI